MKNMDTTKLISTGNDMSYKTTPYKAGSNTGTGKLQEAMYKAVTKLGAQDKGLYRKRGGRGPQAGVKGGQAKTTALGPMHQGPKLSSTGGQHPAGSNALIMMRKKAKAIKPGPECDVMMGKGK